MFNTKDAHMTCVYRMNVLLIPNVEYQNLGWITLALQVARTDSYQALIRFFLWSSSNDLFVYMG